MCVEITKVRTNYQIRFPYDKNLQEYIKSLPKDQQQTKMSSFKDENGVQREDWYRLVNDAALAKIIDYIKNNNLKFKFINLTAEEIEKIKNDYLERKTRTEVSVLNKAKDLDVSNLDFSFMKMQPYDYQKQAVLFFEGAGGKAILGDSPGVGKSLSLISYATKNKLKTLVICPASLKLNWRNEINRFTNEKPFVFKYKPKKNSGEIINIKEESLFHIINYESLETFVKYMVHHKCTFGDCKWEETNSKKKYKECPKCLRAKAIKSRASHLEFGADKDGVVLNPKDYDLVALDESQLIKNSETARTKLVKKAFAETPKKILLTGTAIKSRPYEFFSQLNFVDPKEWKNAHHFGVKYCNGKETNFGWDYSGSSNLEELYQRISPYFLRRLKSEVLKFLPPKTFTEIPIELTTEEYKKYKSIERDVIEDAKENDTEVNYLSKIQKLKQFTSYAKTLRAIEFIQEVIDGEEKIVVFTEYLETARKIAEHFWQTSVVFTGEKNMSEKQEAVDKFMNDKKTKVFVGTIGAAGVGITLTSASISLFVDQPYTPADREQAEDRIHRASSKADKIQIIRLYCQDTIDVDIIQLLDLKEKITSKVLDGVETTKNVDKVNANIVKELINIILKKKK